MCASAAFRRAKITLVRIVVASNPTARFGRARGAGAEVERVLLDAGHDVEHRMADGFAALQRAARRDAQGADALVVVGGDGMVHLGVNAVGGTSVPLAVVPAGSGNDFAKAIGMPRGEAAVAALPALLQTPPARCDLIRILHPEGEVFAAGIVSVGFDADVNVRSFALPRVPSRVRYHAAIALTVARLRHRTFRVRIDGGDERREHTVIAAIANNRSLGGGIPLVPNASMTDGLLTGVFADTLTLPRFVRLLTLAMRGAHLDDPRVRSEHFERVELASDDASVLACADGEIIGTLPITCSIAPGALRVFGAPR